MWVFLFFIWFIYLRASEQVHEQRQGRLRERKRVSKQVDAPSLEPDTGLEPRTLRCDPS